MSDDEIPDDPHPIFENWFWKKQIVINMSEIQSVAFPSAVWTVKDAKWWLADNKFKGTKTDITDDFIRFRQEPPGKFTRERTKIIKGHRPDGSSAKIYLIIGFN